MKTPVVAVTMGDPCGVGPEVVALALHDESVWKKCIPVVVGQKEVFNKAIDITKAKIEMNYVEGRGLSEEKRSIEEAVAEAERHVRKVPFLSVGKVDMSNFKFGVPSKVCGRLSFEFIKKAVQMCKEGIADGIATAPVNKATLKLAGIKYIDHTEMLKDLTGSEEAIMMFEVEKLRVFFLTRHLPLKEALNQVKKEKVLETLKVVNRYLERFVRKPRIAVAALNPHAGDQGLFGREEIEELEPAVKEARSIGIAADGPYPADTVFYRGANGEFDAVLALYHDQGHIAPKMYDFRRTVSVTLGLPFIRTSVDHGTAYDIAGKGIADPTSMIEAIIAAATYSRSSK